MSAIQKCVESMGLYRGVHGPLQRRCGLVQCRRKRIESVQNKPEHLPKVLEKMDYVDNKRLGEGKRLAIMAWLHSGRPIPTQERV